MAEPLLEIAVLDAGYGPAQVLFGVSLALGPGEVVALLGRNGAGKSTLIKAAMGLLPPRAGTVRFAGRGIAGEPAWRIARAGLGYVPEERRVFPDLTVEENLAVGRRPPREGLPAWTDARLFALFPPLAPLARRLAGSLSGGEQQMLAIARTLAGNPRAVLLDEPAEGLAPVVLEPLAEAILDMARAGVAVLVAEQNLDFAAAVADRAVLLARGSVAFDGAMAAVIRDPALRDAILGV
ncbi:MAG: ABC transporter ATP-binding protein [Acetobacteraceae bacterium]